ncbi:MAG: Na(+)/H(+) antiporter subunit B [Arenicella sp.]
MIEQITIMVLLAFLVIIVLGIIWLKDLFAAVILLGIYSLTTAATFVVMDAVDVAFTEAAVGAGISTILLLGALSLTEHKQKPQGHNNIVAIIFVVITGALLIYGSLDIAAYGSLDSASYMHPLLAQWFIEQSGSETGVPNIVTSVLASYRGYDTLGETVVVFTAAVAVWSLIGLRHVINSKNDEQEAETRRLAEVKSEKRYRQRHIILQVTSKLLIPFIILFAFYVQFHGDYGPGGGFQAGVIFAAGFILHGLIFGVHKTRDILTPRALRFSMSIGVLLYLFTGVTGMLLGGNFLDYNVLAHDPLHGQHWGIFTVELGVGITVASVMLILFYSFSLKPANKPTNQG